MKAVYLYFRDSGNEKGIIAYPIRRVRPSKLSEEGSFTCKLIIPSSRRPRRNPAGLVTITTIYKTNMIAGWECSSIGLEHTATNGKVESSNLFIPSRIHVVTSFFKIISKDLSCM